MTKVTVTLGSYNSRELFLVDMSPSQMVSSFSATGFTMRHLNGHVEEYVGNFHPAKGQARGSISSVHADEDGEFDFLFENMNLSLGTLALGHTWQELLEIAFLRNDMFVGGSGNDRIWGYGGNDRIEGGEGADELSGDEGSDVLLGGAGNDQLDGGTGRDSLYGGDGHDGLDGGPGADLMDGGAGNDTYHIDNVRDQVIDSGGSDTLWIKLAKLNTADFPEIERFLCDGSHRTVIGDGRDNLIQGGMGGNVMSGSGGNDTLMAYGGGNTLTGGDGADLFAIDAGGRKNVIKDFQAGVDKIGVPARGMPFNDGLNLATGLTADQFHIGAQADDANQRLIYDPAKSTLYYDYEGWDGHHHVAIASFAKGTVLGLDDFVLL